jgi:hypothetical protein
VTGGSLCLIGSSGRDFNFEAKDLTVTVSLGDAGSFPIVAGAVTAGSSFNPSGTLAGEQTLRFGPVDFQGVSYASLFFSGSLQFAANPEQRPGGCRRALRAECQLRPRLGSNGGNASAVQRSSSTDAGPVSCDERR